MMIRPAEVDEACILSDLALRSKAVWNYDPTFLEACRQDLTLYAQDIQENLIYVMEKNGHVIGFYGLYPKEDGAVELEFLFVDPDVIGQGYGKKLWEHAVETARTQGFTQMFINSDPNSEEFYRAMGARRIGQSVSVVDSGRLLPLLAYAIAG